MMKTIAVILVSALAAPTSMLAQGSTVSAGQSAIAERFRLSAESTSLRQSIEREARPAGERQHSRHGRPIATAAATKLDRPASSRRGRHDRRPGRGRVGPRRVRARMRRSTRKGRVRSRICSRRRGDRGGNRCNYFVGQTLTRSSASFRSPASLLADFARAADD